MEINNFLGRESFQWSGGDANQLFIFIWPYIYMEFVYKPIKKEILNTTTPAGGLAVGSSVQV